MTHDYSHLRAVFFEEAAEHLARLEAGILRLESAPTDADLLNDIFRAAHSIKGSGGVFGLTDVARYTHALEEVLNALRERRMAVRPELVDVLLRARDCLAEVIEATKAGRPMPAAAEALIAELQATLPAADATGAADATPAADVPPAASRVVRVRIAPEADLLRAGNDPLLLLRDLAELGEVRSVRADTSKLPALAALDPERAYLG